MEIAYSGYNYTITYSMYIQHMVIRTSYNIIYVALVIIFPYPLAVV